MSERPTPEQILRKAARDLYQAEVRRQGIGWDDYCTELLVRTQHALAALTARDDVFGDPS